MSTFLKPPARQRRYRPPALWKPGRESAPFVPLGASPHHTDTDYQPYRAVAAELGLDAEVLHHAIALEEVDAVPTEVDGRGYLVLRSDVETWLAERAEPAETTQSQECDGDAAQVPADSTLSTVEVSE